MIPKTHRTNLQARKFIQRTEMNLAMRLKNICKQVSSRGQRNVVQLLNLARRTREQVNG